MGICQLRFSICFLPVIMASVGEHQATGWLPAGSQPRLSPQPIPVGSLAPSALAARSLPAPAALRLDDIASRQQRTAISGPWLSSVSSVTKLVADLRLPRTCVRPEHLSGKLRPTKASCSILRGLGSFFDCWILTGRCKPRLMMMMMMMTTTTTRRSRMRRRRRRRMKC